jgi:hypothetical protein
MTNVMSCVRLFVLASVTASATVFAQSEPAKKSVEEQLREIQEQIQLLNQKAEELARQIEAEKPDEQQPATSEDLLAVEPLEQPAPAEEPQDQPAQQPAEEPKELPSDLVANPSGAAAAKVFNPDISVIGNFVGHLGEVNPEERDSMALEEAEVAFEAFVDPYAKAKFFVAAGPEGVELEEGYINFISLPWDLTAKVGKMKATFGKINPTHPHVRPWVDQPLVLSEFFGDEGLNDSGLSISKLFPNDSGLVIEATGEVFRGEVEEVFERQAENDLFYLGRLKLFRDLTENSNLEIGASVASGTLPEVGGENRFGGFDVTYRWKPLSRSIYRSFISRTEFITNDRADREDMLSGFYTSADYQFARRWIAGVRFDQVDRTADEGRNRAESLTLTFWPSEFSQLRGQLRNVDFEGEDSGLELLLQVQFSIGAHGAHAF